MDKGIRDIQYRKDIFGIFKKCKGYITSNYMFKYV